MSAYDVPVTEQQIRGVIAHASLPYPHAGGCATCFEVKRCNHCGISLRLNVSRCTNGRCGKCHASVCTPAGATSPGHGYGGGVS